MPRGTWVIPIKVEFDLRVEDVDQDTTITEAVKVTEAMRKAAEAFCFPSNVHIESPSESAS